MSATTVEEALIEWLTSAGAVRNIVGKKVYRGFVPQAETLPAIEFVLRGVRDKFETLDSEGTTSSDRRYKFTCLGSTPEESVALSYALKDRLNGCQGTFGDVLIMNISRDEETQETNYEKQALWVESFYTVTANK